MIYRLIILLLIVGCDELSINEQQISDGTSVTDTLYISYDTTYTVYDTLIVSFDTTITYNYDTTIFAIDTVYINSIDCDGVEGGTAQYDNCGVCDTDLSNDCVPDCAGEWGGDAYLCDGICGVSLWDVCYSIENTTEIDFDYQELTGEIPVEIGNLTNLTELHLGWNQLTAIPESFCNIIDNIISYNYFNNKICGELPSCLTAEDIGEQDCN